MKKLVSFFLLIILVVGVSGCMKQPSEKENKAKELEMLSYLKDKYKQDFTAIDYIPAKRGFNDDYNLSILVAKSENGIVANVKEKVVDEGYYFDDFLNAYASKMYDEKLNYNSINNLQAAKTYVSLRISDIDFEELKASNFPYSQDIVIDLLSVIAISEPATEEGLKHLYEIYQQMQSFGYEDNYFFVAFGGNKDKQEKYTNNYNLYGVEDPEEYDQSVKETLQIKENGLTFEEFKAQLQ